MKYLEVPKPTTALVQGQSIDYTFARFLDEVVWPDPMWRTDREWWGAYKELRVLFSDCVPGSIVGMEDSAFEKLFPIAVQRGRSINGAMSFLEAMMDPFFGVSSKDPRKAENETQS